MFEFLRTRTESKAPPVPRAEPLAVVEWAGLPPFVIADHAEMHEGFPFLRWRDVYAWMEGLPEPDRGGAWTAVGNAWDDHLARGLGPSYRVTRGDGVLVISSLGEREAGATLDYMQKTLRRILRSLEGVARRAEYGSEMLLLLDDEDAYYRYISRFYPEKGEFAASGGMKVNDDGCYYYVGVRGHLRDMEGMIAHEMTHGAVSHLPLPTWLNEGIAVNMEQALVRGTRYPAEEMRRRHLGFWTPERVQEFWSGESYHLPGDPNELSYDFGRILVQQLAADWPRFAAFARAADWSDGGAAAAREHLGISLGAAAAAFLESDVPDVYEPRPEAWRRPEEPPSQE